MYSVLHFADAHWSAEPDKLEKAANAVQAIIEIARKRQPDLIAIAGDYWDKRQVLNDQSAVIPALDAVKALAGTAPVVMIKGNEEHDNSGSYEIFRGLKTQFPVHVAESARTLRVDNMRTGSTAVVHCLPFPTKQHFLYDSTNMSIDEANAKVLEALRAILLGFAAEHTPETSHIPRILVGHANVREALLSSGQTLIGQDLLIPPEYFALADVDYTALGHIHRRQQVAPGVWYSGSTYHCNFGEPERKGVNWVEIDTNKQVTVEPIWLPSRNMVLVEVVYEDGKLAVKATGMESTTDADVRARVSLTREQMRAVTDADVAALFPLAYSVKAERIPVPDNRVRAAEITQAVTLRDKIMEWGKAVDREIPATVLDAADTTEKAVKAA